MIGAFHLSILWTTYARHCYLSQPWYEISLRLNPAERSNLTQSTGFRCVQSAKSTLEKLNGFRCCHAAVILDASQDPTCTGPPGVDISRDWCQQGISTGVPSDQGHRSTLTDTAPHAFGTSVPSGTPSTHAFVQYQEQRTSRDQHQQTQKTGKGPTRSSQRLAGMDGAPKGRYSCNLCDKRYSQRQGVRRHQREAHDAHLCMYCRDYAWGRPYRLREHLVKRHPDVDPDAALEQATGTRHRPTMIPRGLPHERVSSSPPTFEYFERGGVESLLQPLTLHPLAVTQLQPVSPLTQSSLGYDQQSELADVTIPCTDGGSQMAKDLDASAGHIQTWLAHALIL